MAELIGRLLFEIVWDVLRDLIYAIFRAAGQPIFAWVAANVSRRTAVILALLAGLALVTLVPMIALLMAH